MSRNKHRVDHLNKLELHHIHIFQKYIKNLKVKVKFHIKKINLSNGGIKPFRLIFVILLKTLSEVGRFPHLSTD